MSTLLESFSVGTPVSLPLQNQLPVKHIWPGCCDPGLVAAIEEPLTCIEKNLSSGKKGLKGGFETLTSAMLVQCSAS